MTSAYAPPQLPRTVRHTRFALIVNAQIHAQDLKKVRIGYPAFSLTFLTFFVAIDSGIYRMKAVVRATFEAMEFNRSWMVDYSQNRWKLSPKVAEDSYRVWLNGFTSGGKIPLSDLQEISTRR